MQPFIALGRTLKSTYGHRVRIATHPTFQKFVEENGLEFFSIGGDPAELMAFMVKNPGLMPGFDSLKSGDVGKRRKGMEEIVIGCWRSCIEAGNGLGPPVNTSRGMPLTASDDSSTTGPQSSEDTFIADAIIANPPSFAHIHIAEKLGIPLHLMFTMPWSPTQNFCHPLANIQSSNVAANMTNFMSYAMVELMTWQGLGDIINRFRSNVLGLDPVSLIWAPGMLTRLRVPYTYCWSPALIPKPKDWGQHISISGFYFLSLASSFVPDPELAAFLAAGPPPVYIGFGSIVVDDPNAMTKLIFDAVKRTGVRALVSKGWGGLGADALGIPDGVYMLGNVPHDWLFKHVSCVVHHGGAGTTAAGVALGRPTVIVPFFGDQPFWGNMIASAGAGPPPIPYKELTGEKLAAAILEALKPTSLERAQELGEKIRSEKGTEVGGKAFHDHLDVDKLRCSLAPSRVAVWRVKKSDVRLSTFAASLLVKEGLLSFSDLKLFRARDFDVEDGPWDPISGGASALVGTLASLSMGVADLPIEAFRSMKKQKPNSNATEPVLHTTEESVIQGNNAEEAHDASSDSDDIYGVESQKPASNSSSQTLAIQNDATRPRSGTPKPVSSPASSAPQTEMRQPIIGGQEQNGGSASKFSLESAVSTGKGISRIVGAGMKSPMDFTLGLARGFHNAPKLYGDDTVRPQAKVTDFQSGLAAAGKEFTYGMYDGITGLITQPLRGAEKEGAAGLWKGIGRGIGGLVLKPGAAVWGIPGYTMMGIHKEIKGMFGNNVDNYLVSIRTAQGNDALSSSTIEERRATIARWKNKRPGMLASEGTQGSKSVGKERSKQRSQSPKGFFQTRHMTFEERKRLQEQRQARDSGGASSSMGVHSEATSAATPQISAPTTETSRVTAETSEEFEQIIKASVASTSRGNAAEDAAIERAIRASVRELQSAGLGLSEEEALQRALHASSVDVQPSRHNVHDNLERDREYEEELERALRESRIETEHTRQMDRHGKDASGEVLMVDNDVNSDDGEEVRRALKMSKSANQAKQATRTEEEIVMEYVMKQSLLEEEHRRKVKSSTATVTQGATKEIHEDDNDEELRKAIAESMKMSSASSSSAPAPAPPPSYSS